LANEILADEILLTERKDHVCTLILNRPEKRNSLSPELLFQIRDTLDGLAKDDTVRAIVFRGTGDKAFSSGYDISAIPTGADPEMQERFRKENPLQTALESVINYPYPVIAMLNGYAFGAGCELSICCDIRIGADDIRMGMPPAKLGVVYDPNGIQRFINVIGLSKTKEVFFSGRYFEASTAKEMGLVDHLLPRGELESYTYELAEEIGANAPLSLKGTKRVINLLVGSAQMADDEWTEARAIIAEAFNSEDLKEAQASFMAKRKPVFKGR
jgi:enoyl-CoA hydratase/carnithine racemase